MKTYLPDRIKTIFFLMLFFSLTSCSDSFKCSSKENTARPTVPDNKGRNIGSDGSSDKLIDPFYKKGIN